MADKKISQLTAATTPLAGTEVLPIVQSSTTVKVAVSDLTAGRAVSATQFTPTGGSATGNTLYLPATNSLGFVTNGTERVRIDSSGNVGVGTTSPTAAVEIARGSGASAGISLRANGNAAATEFVMIQGSDGVTAFVYNRANGAIAFGTNNSTRMTIASTGNVAIGTGVASWGSTVVLQVGLSGVFEGRTSSSTQFGSNYYWDGTDNRYTNTAAAAIMSISGSEFRFYQAPSGSSGTVATFTQALVVDSNNNVLATGPGGLGYGTGSGGAVTQATSRTTGVTLNKSNGAITLVSAAGTTAWQSFTVTNSVVAATDTIIVNQKSGTDLYQIFVTNVAAGSFKITFATTGGTTTEQPVFNFAVIKAVTS